MKLFTNLMNLLLLSLALLGVCQDVFTHDACPIVSAPIGKFQGSILNNSFGKPIFSFRGIRYAEAPIKELRFKPPVPVKRHEGVYNAEEDAPVCPQPTKDPISEDCLFLNVYTTELPHGQHNPRRPVIVYLHYGGFFSSSGRSNTVGPQYLLNKDIVLVTFNYRLGTLGFLSTGEKEAIGNYGLKDQVAALKWVQANIEAFGGDPNSVTIFGYSAGAISVTLHLVSPMSEGLFHKAIIGSSSDLGNIPLGRNQLFVAKRQGKAVGCPIDTTANLVKCLKKTPAEELGNSLEKLFEVPNFPGLIWKPVAEPDFGQERFLTDHPVKLIREGKFHKVPVLAGVTKDEFGFLAPVVLRNDSLLKKFNGAWDHYAPIVFLFERDTDRSLAISNALKSFYFDNNRLADQMQPQLAELFADGDTAYGVNKAVKLMAEHSKQSVYYYRFSYQGKYSFIYTPESNGTVPYGVSHLDDLLYVFYNPAVTPKFGPHDVEFKVVEKLTTMWTDFAIHGNPIVETCGKLDFAEWPVYDMGSRKYMDIGERLTLRERLNDDRYALWDKLFPESEDHVKDITY